MVKPVGMDEKGKGNSWKFPKKYYSLLFGAIMGLIMSLLTSVAVAMINIGIVPNFFQIWFSIFLTTLIIGFPITIVVTPFVKNIVDRIT
jgi:hypothetical protein